MDKSLCPKIRWWLIVIISLSIIIVLLLVFLIVAYNYKPLRKKLFPFARNNRNKSVDDDVMAKGRNAMYKGKSKVNPAYEN